MAGVQSLFQITVVRGFTAQTLDSHASLTEITASMTRWEQVEKLCQAALELEEHQRSAFLEEACRGDEELRREVESLLQFDRRQQRFIEQPAAEVAAKMIAHEKPES